MFRAHRLACISLVCIMGLLLLVTMTSFAAKEIVWLTRSNPVENSWERAAIAQFEKSHPNIKVKQIIVPWDQYDTKMSTMFAAGSPPDIFSNWAWNGFMDMTLRGMTLNLDPLIERDKLDLGDFYPYAAKYYRWQGGTYGIPMMIAPSGVWYNKNLFDEAGVSYPSVDASDKSWNWNALLEKAKKLTKDKNGDGRIDQFGVNASYDLWGGFPSIVWLFGGDIFPDEAYSTGIPTKCSLDNPIAIEAAQAVADLIYKHHVAPTPAEGQAMSTLGDPFRTSRLAMTMTGGWGWWNYNNITTFTVGAAVLPWGNPTRNRELVVGCDPWLIAKTSKNVDEAWEFVKYMIGPEGQKVFIEKMGMIPPVKSQFINWTKHWSKIPQEDLNTIFNSSLKYGRASADHRLQGYLEIGKLINTELDPMMLGKKDAAQCLKSAQVKLMKLLEDRQKAK